MSDQDLGITLPNPKTPPTPPIPPIPPRPPIPPIPSSAPDEEEDD